MCLIVIAAVIVAWSGDRAKPLVIFPLAIGMALGGAASLMANYCQLRRNRTAVVVVILSAWVVVITSFGLAAFRQQLNSKPTNPLAERLLQQLDKHAVKPDTSPTDLLENYLQRRYGQQERIRWMWRLLGEAALAGIGAAALIRWCWLAVTEPVRIGTS